MVQALRHRLVPLRRSTPLSGVLLNTGSDPVYHGDKCEETNNSAQLSNMLSGAKKKEYLKWKRAQRRERSVNCDSGDWNDPITAEEGIEEGVERLVLLRQPGETSAP